MKVFVLMPYGSHGEYQGGYEESNYIFDEIIAQGVKLSLSGQEYTIDREFDESKPGSVTSSIVRKLVESEIVIVDMTGKNPNVCLELGIRYALRNKATIILAQKETEIPFDMKGYRHIFYNKFKPKIARQKISDAILSSLSDDNSSDSIVFDTYKNLFVSIPGTLSSCGDECENDGLIMSWDEYLGRIDWIVKKLQPVVAEANYIPDAIFGISNGGLIVADILGKILFAAKDIPVLSLWARRWSRDRTYFRNPYNNAILDTINSEIKVERGINILLVDDHFGTGYTATQAIDYIVEILGEKARILYMPLVSQTKENFIKVEEYFPYNYKKDNVCIFNIDRNEFEKHLHTKAKYFPYPGIAHKQIKEGLEQILTE